MNKVTSTRDKILRTAYELFLREGYSEVSLNRLVKSAGITKGGFYHHFASKDELFAEVVDRYLIAFYKKLREEMLEAEGSSREKLKTLCGQFCSLPARLLEDHQEELEFGYYILIFQGVKHYPRFVEKLARVYGKMRSAVAEILSEGIKMGEIRSGLDCEATAFQIVSQAEGALLMWTLDKSIDLAEYNRRVFDNIWLSIRA
ncbi:MAG: TetR/AcrR family transcriptional regulator [Candidatus Krumholzibacteriales bacterium]